jgi:hypothetical protein
VTWNLDSGRGLAAAATGDLQLRAREIELGRRSRVVDAELLDAEEVLAGGDLAGDGHRVCGCPCVSRESRSLREKVRTAQIPLGLAGGEVRANLLDLEPVTGAVCSGSAVDFGHIEGDGTLVVNGLVCCERDR